MVNALSSAQYVAEAKAYAKYQHGIYQKLMLKGNTDMVSSGR